MRTILFFVFLLLGIKLRAQTNDAVGTIYMSHDHGTSWSRSDVGFPSGDVVNAWAISHEFIFAGTNSHGVMISSDKGKSWSKSLRGLPPAVRVTALVASNDVLFAGTFQHGIYMSTNQGSSWQPFSEGIRSGTVELYHKAIIITVRAFHENSGGLYVGTNDGIYVLANSKWIKLGGDYQVNDFASNEKYTYAATHQGVIRTADGGLHWENVYRGAIFKIAIEGNRVCLLDYSGVVHYSNAGQMIWFKDETYMPVRHSYQLTPSSQKMLIPASGIHNILINTPASGLPPNTPFNNLLQTPFGVFASAMSLKGC